MKEKEQQIVSLHQAGSPMIASLIVQALRFEGIPAYIDGCLLQDEFAISQRVLGLNCVEIKVPKECLQEAQAILLAMREAGKLAEEGGETPNSEKSSG